MNPRIPEAALVSALLSLAVGWGCAEQSSTLCSDEACHVSCRVQGYTSGECSAGSNCLCVSGGDADADAIPDTDAPGGDEASLEDVADLPAADDGSTEAEAGENLAGTPGHVGGACAGDSDCVDPGATCLTNVGGVLRFPNGYCTIIGCVLGGTPSCPTGTACQCGTGCMCLQVCTSADDCRSGEGYTCASTRCLPLPI